jgi:hypothetical protein
MISRGVLIGSLGPVIVVGSVMVGTLGTGTEQRDSSNAEAGSCDTYSGLPTGKTTPRAWRSSPARHSSGGSITQWWHYDSGANWR